MARFYATTDPAPSERERTAKERSRRIAAEGMVLLENNGVLPMELKGRRIALFGSGARHTVAWGTGSGEVNVREISTVECGLLRAGARIVTKDWLDRCDEEERRAREAFVTKLRSDCGGDPGKMFWAACSYHALKTVLPNEEELVPADGETAIYVLSRNSGEGGDRRNLPGDYQPEDEERKFLEILCAHYRHVVVVLNVGGVIDTSFLRGQPGIDAILLMGQAGSAGGEALADVLEGKVSPCGRLASTWAERYEDYPNAASFGSQDGDTEDEYYTEGIFVGYRYFDSFGKTPAYPFGYGGSYTSFSMTVKEAAVREGTVSLSVRVTNTGTVHAAKEVVQVYVSSPEGRLDKPYQELRAYAKTETLFPGGSEELSLAFPVSRMASYDEEQSAWVLEAGDYIVRVGGHSRATTVACVLRLKEEVVCERLKREFPPDCEMECLSADRSLFYAYASEEAELAAAPVLLLCAQDVRPMGTAAPEWLGWADRREHAAEGTAGSFLTMEDVDAGRCTIEELAAQLTVEELAALCVGSARGGLGQSSFLGMASTLCPGAAGDTTSTLLESRGVRNMVLADGPAGLRLSRSFTVDEGQRVVKEEAAIGGEMIALLWNPEDKTEDAEPAEPQEKTEGGKESLSGGSVTYYQYCTAIPTASLLAQTWDFRALWEAGDIVGTEMEEFGISLWLAPGMNIHRNPLCGRNFEYYSEDPLLSGLCAAADTEGVQAHPGAGTTIKHFACNNQEDNRTHSNSHVTERALREIYLRGFEIAVRTAQPMAIMTSYNLLNGVHTANSAALIDHVARGEWGFAGLVMTDWNTTEEAKPDENGRYPKYGSSDPAACIRAGNDLIMPGSQRDVDRIVEAVKAAQGGDVCPLTLNKLRACAARILRVLAACGPGDRRSTKERKNKEG